MNLYICHEKMPAGPGPYREVRALHPREAALAYAREADQADAPAAERTVIVRHPGERTGPAFVVTRETRPAYHARET